MSKDRRGPKEITRREALQKFGMLGGGSLVMGLMKEWELTPAIKFKRAAEGLAPADTTVLVLGGGISGMVAGYELGKRGYKYTVLEARDRVGGLAWSVKRGNTHTELPTATGGAGETQTCQFDEGQYINAGPWRLPHIHEGVMGYVRELNIPLERFNDDTVAWWSDAANAGTWRGKLIRQQELKADMGGYTAELLAKALNQGALDQALTAEDKTRLLTYLTNYGYLTPDRVYQVTGNLPLAEMRGGPDRYDLSFLLGGTAGTGRVLQTLMRGTGMGDPVYQPVGGMQMLSEAFRKPIGNNLVFNSEITKVLQTEKDVTVTVLDTKTNRTRQMKADYIIVCLPMSIFKKMDVNLGTQGMKDAVQAATQAPQARMGLQMKSRFWEKELGIYGGHLATNLPIPSFSYPSENQMHQKGVLLGYYGGGNANGADGKRLIDGPVKDRIEHVLTNASKVHPQMRAEFDNAYAIWWDRVKYSEGSWPNGNPTTLSHGDGRIYIGSAANSDHGSWQEGGVAGAHQAIDMIHKRVLSGA